MSDPDSSPFRCTLPSLLRKRDKRSDAEKDLGGGSAPTSACSKTRPGLCVGADLREALAASAPMEELRQIGHYDHMLETQSGAVKRRPQEYRSPGIELYEQEDAASSDKDLTEREKRIRNTLMVIAALPAATTEPDNFEVRRLYDKAIFMANETLAAEFPKV